MTLLLREAIGERLRRTRTSQRRTLREVSRAARVSLGYLSEVERGRKEASSELLAAICNALELPLHELLHGVAGDLGPVYLPGVPDTVPADLVAESVADERVVTRPGIEGGRMVTATPGRPIGAEHRRQAELRIASAEPGTGAPRAMVGAAA